MKAVPYAFQLFRKTYRVYNEFFKNVSGILNRMAAAGRGLVNSYDKIQASSMQQYFSPKFYQLYQNYRNSRFIPRSFMYHQDFTSPQKTQDIEISFLETLYFTKNLSPQSKWQRLRLYYVPKKSMRQGRPYNIQSLHSYTYTKLTQRKAL